MAMEDRIERYIRNLMAAPERAEFEHEFQNNPLLKEQVELEQDIVHQIRSRAYVDEQIKQAKEELKQEKFEAYILNLMTQIERAEFENDLENNPLLKEQLELEQSMIEPTKQTEEELKQERFEEYIFGSMSEAKRAYFEDDLENDPLLKEQLELEQSIVDKIREHAFVEPQIRKAKKELQRGKIIRLVSYSVASVAASFLIFFLVYNIYQNQQFDKLFTSNFSAYSNDLIAADGSYRGDGLYRGDAEINSVLQSAMTAYEKKDYSIAETQFDQLLTTKYNPEIQFYQAISQIETGKTELAINTLNILYLQPTDFQYYEQTRWYLALVHLKLYHKSDAKRYLDELVALGGVYWDKAKELLAKL